MNNELKEILEKCNKATSPNDVEFDLIENGWGVRYIRIDDVMKINEKTTDIREEVSHFFEMEIEQTKEWLKEECFDCYNGVQVGHEQAIELMKKHISFCEHILKMLEESKCMSS